MEEIYFRYKSIGNMCRLLVDIYIEKTYPTYIISLYHERFRNEDDSIYEDFLIKLYPNGCTIDEKEIKHIAKYIIDDFMSKDEKSLDLQFNWKITHYHSYVAFIPDKKVIECSTASHQQTVKDILIDYFKGFDDINSEFLKRFIKNNFIIRSDFTDIETVCRDIDYLIRCILIANRYRGDNQ